MSVVNRSKESASLGNPMFRSDGATWSTQPGRFQKNCSIRNFEGKRHNGGESHLALIQIVRRPVKRVETLGYSFVSPE